MVVEVASRGLWDLSLWMRRFECEAGALSVGGQMRVLLWFEGWVGRR